MTYSIAMWYVQCKPIVYLYIVFVLYVGAVHFIYHINRITTAKVDTTYNDDIASKHSIMSFDENEIFTEIYF